MSADFRFFKLPFIGTETGSSLRLWILSEIVSGTFTSLLLIRFFSISLKDLIFIISGVFNSCRCGRLQPGLVQYNTCSRTNNSPSPAVEDINNAREHLNIWSSKICRIYIHRKIFIIEISVSRFGNSRLFKFCSFFLTYKTRTYELELQWLEALVSNTDQENDQTDGNHSEADIEDVRSSWPFRRLELGMLSLDGITQPR